MDLAVNENTDDIGALERALMADIAAAVRKKILDDLLAVRFGENHRAAGIANELVAALDHAVALAGRGRLYLAGRGDLEPLLGGRFGLHLGHFAFLVMGAQDCAELASGRPA